MIIIDSTDGFIKLLIFPSILNTPDSWIKSILLGGLLWLLTSFYTRINVLGVLDVSDWLTLNGKYTFHYLFLCLYILLIPFCSRVLNLLPPDLQLWIKKTVTRVLPHTMSEVRQSQGGLTQVGKHFVFLDLSPLWAIKSDNVC